MGEMTPESERRDGSGWVLAIVLIGLVALLGAGGTWWGYTAARQAREMEVVARVQAEEMRARALMESERAEASARAAEQEMLKARLAEQAAIEERGKSEAVTEFLETTITGADPAKNRGQNPGVREILDDAAKKLDAGEIKDPDAAASLHSTVGMSYMSLGHYEQAEKHLRAAVEFRKQARGEGSTEVAKDMENLATVLKMQGK